MSDEEKEGREKKKVFDFFKGFLITVVDFLLGIILMIGEYIAIDSSYRVPIRYFSNILLYLFLIIPIILIFLFLKKNRIYLVIGIAIGYYGFSVMTENVYIFFYGPFVAIGAFLYYRYLKIKLKKSKLKNEV